MITIIIHFISQHIVKVNMGWADSVCVNSTNISNFISANLFLI